ncbi:hypothetical protein HID58_081628 [Brassica napus]|uniref:Uncharacterized protein n=1 Tax=Brassica napus TaxID=3708 RepID=A0ABQ7YA05_BRANA|nr:hypothetical protein HID58_081628 [Brassica napus]
MNLKIYKRKTRERTKEHEEFGEEREEHEREDVAELTLVPCRSSGLEPSSKVVSSLGGTTRSRGGRGVRRSDCMFELWFREMEATTDPSSPAFLREVEAPSAPPTPVQVHGKGIRAADEKPEAFGSSAKLEVGGGVLVLMMKLSAEVKSVKSTIRWFSMRASRVLSGSKAEMISCFD